MNRTSIKGSSNIAEVGYDHEEMTLEIKFHNGSIYQYSPITLEGWRTFMRAPSLGKYFAQYIRSNSQIDYRKVDDLQSETK